MSEQSDGGVWYLTTGVYEDQRESGKGRVRSGVDAAAAATLYGLLWLLFMDSPSVRHVWHDGTCEVDDCPRDSIDGYTRCVRHGAGLPGTHDRL